MLSSLDISKATGLYRYSIPTKVLKLLKSDISDQLSNLFNLSFTTGSFPTLLKIDKVIPTHKKEPKLDYTNYRPISLLSNLDKHYLSSPVCLSTKILYLLCINSSY